jgi:hypothetical protein
MKVYIAGAYCYRDVIRERVVPILNRLGHEVTSGWLQGSRPITEGTIGASMDRATEKVKESTEGDFQDILDADVLLLLTAHAMVRLAANDAEDWNLPTRTTDIRLHTGGRHVEVGFALAEEIPVVVAGPPENVFQRSQTDHFESLAEALDHLNAMDALKDEDPDGMGLLGAGVRVVDSGEPRNTEWVNDAHNDPRGVRFSG